MQVVADAALFAVADFENLPFQALALGDVARDAFHLDKMAVQLDEPRADLQFYALARAGDKIPLGGAGRGAFEHLFQPLLGCGLLFGNNQVQCDLWR